MNQVVWMISALVFENKLGQLKKFICKPQQPIQQVLRHLGERQLFGAKANTSILKQVTKSEHSAGPILPRLFSARQVRTARRDKRTLSLNTGNNCVLLTGGIPARLKNIVRTDKDIILLCAKFEIMSEAFALSLHSSKLNICKVEIECRKLYVVSLTDVASVFVANRR